MPEFKKQIYNLKIDPELRDLLPPLTGDEYKQLEKQIVEDGCTDALLIWHGYIADGHNRYKICHEHNIPFGIYPLGYKTKSEVMRRMIDDQLGRRNLTPIQRIAIAKKYEGQFREEAKERQATSTGGNNPQLISNWNKAEKSPIIVSKEIAKLADVGSGTLARYDVVIKSDDEDTKQKMLNEKISINAAYNKVKPKIEKDNINIKQLQKSKINEKLVQHEDITTKKCLKCKQEKLLSEFKEGSDFCNECMKHINEPIQDNSYIDDSTDVGKVIKELKTPKVAADYIVVEDELLSIKNSIQEMIDTAYERIFERYDLPNKMTQEDKNNAVCYMNQLNGEILKLKSKIEKIEIKGEN